MSPDFPKPRTEGERSLEFFTNREEPLERVRNLALTSTQEDFRVLAFWGVAGVGKSTFLAKVCEDLPDRLPVARCDLRALPSAVETDRGALVHLRSRLEEQGISFPSFDTCLSIMRMAESREAPPLLSARPGFLRAWEFARDLASLGLLAHFEEAVGVWVRKKPEREAWVRRIGGTGHVQELLLRARSQDPTLPGELLSCFVDDLEQSAKSSAGTFCRSVLLLDHFESLWSGERPGIGGPGTLVDAWVRQFAARCLAGGILLVIASRESLKWSEDWDGRLEQHNLDSLAESDSRLLLHRLGIGPAPHDSGGRSPLQDAIVAASNTNTHGPPACHPLYLGLCADIAENERLAEGSAPDPSLFFGIPKADVSDRLARLFLSSLRTSRMELWVTELALAPRFDQAAAMSLDQARSHFCGRDGWRQLKKYSFVTSDSEGWAQIHPLLRNALCDRLEEDAPEDVHDIHQWFEKYWREREEASLALSHSFALNPDATLQIWNEVSQQAIGDGALNECWQLFDLWADTDLGPRLRSVLGDSKWAAVHEALGRTVLKWPVETSAALLHFALDCFANALEAHTQEQSPANWANVMNNIGFALLLLGGRESGTARLEEAVIAFRAALEVKSRNEDPLDWAAIQNNLALALLRIGEKEPGTSRFEEAIAIFQAVLEVRRREQDPTGWAQTQNNMALALNSLGERDPRKTRFNEAVAAFRAALEVLTRNQDPLAWANAQYGLGSALAALGQRESEMARLEQAVTAFRAALEVWTRDHHPAEWSKTQNNLGQALLSQGDRDSGPERLKEAAAAFRAALEVWNQEQDPYRWATVQANLGVALRCLGERESGTERLKEAVTAYRAALEVRTRLQDPIDWALLQHNLATSLATWGEREPGTKRLEEAVTAYRAALEVRVRDQDPISWALTQNNLGGVLQTLGEREPGTARFEEAAAAFRGALEVRTREQDPHGWAMTKNNLGTALTRLGERQPGTERLEQAVGVFFQVLEVHTREENPYGWALAQNNLGSALTYLGAREPGTARLEQAVRAYMAAMEIYTPDHSEHLYQRLQANLDDVLRLIHHKTQQETGGSGSLQN